VPFLQHYSDHNSRTNPNAAALLYIPDATSRDEWYMWNQMVQNHNTANIFLNTA
jgi:hypothetical protein